MISIKEYLKGISPTNFGIDSENTQEAVAEAQEGELKENCWQALEYARKGNVNKAHAFLKSAWVKICDGYEAPPRFWLATGLLQVSARYRRHSRAIAEVCVCSYTVESTILPRRPFNDLWRATTRKRSSKISWRRHLLALSLFSSRIGLSPLAPS